MDFCAGLINEKKLTPYNGHKEIKDYMIKSITDLCNIAINMLNHDAIASCFQEIKEMLTSYNNKLKETGNYKKYYLKILNKSLYLIQNIYSYQYYPNHW